MPKQESNEATEQQVLEAKQRHADYYTKMLMEEAASDESLRAHYPNIDQVIARIENSEVTSKYSVQELKNKLKTIRGY